MDSLLEVVKNYNVADYKNIEVLYDIIRKYIETKTNSLTALQTTNTICYKFGLVVSNFIGSEILDDTFCGKYNDKMYNLLLSLVKSEMEKIK